MSKNKFPQVGYKKFIEFVESYGYVFSRQGSTSHRIYSKAGQIRFLTIPIHNKPLSKTVIFSNLRSMGLGVKELCDFLKKNR